MSSVVPDQDKVHCAHHEVVQRLGAGKYGQLAVHISGLVQGSGPLLHKIGPEIDRIFGPSSNHSIMVATRVARSYYMQSYELS